MKLISSFYFFVVLLSVVPCASYGQDYYPDSLATLPQEEVEPDEPKETIDLFQDENSDEAISLGILHGGGSLIGADFEMLISDDFGLQVGLGLIGLGAGLNYHFKKDNIRSSFVSWQLWNQGIGQSYVQRVTGPLYVYRGKKWFTASLGLGAVLDRGPAFPENIDRTPVILLYSIGVYFLK